MMTKAQDIAKTVKRRSPFHLQYMYTGVVFISIAMMPVSRS
ncbi:hypothetical protein F441_11911 [Phytophthora nicotianae CJ01A1]|uniref:Uncharacterized protein n=1 Tax=Phytophthora nicotianae CJ01A1 TaxID=1317063 RepID=W2WR38_PHYNI|nr:hypothetical protein F441_11911 [Phytophthora nicotianae CJ01A1]